MQDGNTRDMIHSVAAVIAYISDTVTLLPGDVIATGTPAGVGAARRPPRYLTPGDVVEIEVESIGTLRNAIVSREDVSNAARDSYRPYGERCAWGELGACLDKTRKWTR